MSNELKDFDFHSSLAVRPARLGCFQLSIPHPQTENLTMNPSPNPTVLIIEDEPTIADILAENLSEEGYDVEVAPDGNAGLQTWRTRQPNLVVLDVMLPYKSGYEVCKTMRESGDTTPVLFLSAKGQPEDRVQGLLAGG